MKRLLAIAALVFVVLVAGGAAADTFALRLVSQTNSTITLGWEQQPGYGYLFSSAGVLRSRTNDPSRTTVKFSKVTPESYDVDVIVKGANGHYPGVVIPPPPTSTILQTIANGSTIPSIVNWRAVYDANGDGVEDDPGSVQFLVDGAQILSETNAPFGDSFADGSITVANGLHTFVVRAVSDSGSVLATSTVSATVNTATAPACSDTKDNDGDGKVDYPADPGCGSPNDPDETDIVQPPPTGFPNAGNTGVPSGTSLTAYTGPSTITTANTVVDGKTIGCLTVSAPGVVIRNSRISCNGFRVLGGGGTGSGPLLVQDSEIDCQNSNGTGVDVTNATFTRVDVSGCENGFNVGGPLTLEDSWIHNLVTANGAHTDGMQFNQGASNITVRHNTIDPVAGSSGGTSCIIMWDEGNPQNSNVLITNNLMLGSGAAQTMYTPRQGPLTNVRVTNNRMEKGEFGYNGGNGSLVTDWSGNVDNTTGQPISP
jgi:hypothetical protein